MHCDRCNVDFPEGLRYCKWCGEALVDRPRITSELHSCPSCSAAIQPGWTFCKACGERLQGAARPAGAECPGCGAENEAGAPKCLRCGEDLTAERSDAATPDSADAVTTTCASCGEKLDTGSLYCKACGSAVYTEQSPFGGSALLCGACNSYSPLGSQVCRVCEAPLAHSSGTVVDFPSGLTTVQQKAPTLADLDKQLAGIVPPARTEEDSGLDSGANTLMFSGVEQQGSKSLPGTKTAETNMLPGTAGARSEQQSPTQVMHMGRTTGPVEGDETQQAPKPSGDLTSATVPNTAREPSSIKDPQVAPGDQTMEYAAFSPPKKAPGPTTLGLASGDESKNAPLGSENQTAVFVSRPQDTPPAPREQNLGDNIGTRPITPMQPSPVSEPTREIKQPAQWAPADNAAQTGQIGGAPAWNTPEANASTQSDSFTKVASQPLPQKRTGMIIASVVVVLILLGAGGYVAWLLFASGKSTQPPAPPAVVEMPPVTPGPVVPEKPPGPVVPEGMVSVTAGTYTIGRDGADPLEQPAHKVELPAFFIDRAEVTNAAYKMFVDATGHKPPSNWTGKNFPEGRDGFPVTGVTWQDAADYAAWAGKRLPTEAEWEATARGTDGRIYPWGNGFRSGVANIGSKPDKPTPEQYPAGLKENGRYAEGASPAGAVDMIGNAWEWVADEIKVYAGNTESKLELESGVTHRVIRGGAYDGSKSNDATYRGYLDGSLPYPKVGFRCAKDAK